MEKDESQQIAETAEDEVQGAIQGAKSITDKYEKDDTSEDEDASVDS